MSKNRRPISPPRLPAAASQASVPAENAKQVAHLSELLARIDALRGQHGVQYNGKRDLYKVGGYKENPTYADFYEMYERDPIASEIIDRAPETTWRHPPEVGETEKADTETNFTKQWTELVKAHGIFGHLERVDRLSRIGRYAVLLIGARETDDNALKKPLTRRADGTKGLLYLKAYSEKNAQIKTWTVNATDPNYGRPETYELTTSGETTGFKAASIIVHHSRVIHVAESPLNDDVFGRPALRSVFNDLCDYQKITTSTAEAFWQRVADILQALITDPEATLPAKDITELNNQLTELYHDLRKVFVGNKVKLERLAETEPDPSGARKLFETRIATGAKMPQRMLFGSETGERASTEDQKSWLGSIETRQTQRTEPSILRPFVERLIAHGILALPGAKGYEIVWPPLMHASDKEEADTNQARANTAAALVPIGGKPTDLCGVDKDGKVYLVEFKPGDAPLSDIEPPLLEDPKSPEVGGPLPVEGDPEKAEPPAPEKKVA